MKTFRFILSMMLIVVLVGIYGCKEEDSITPPPTINEADVLVKYLEENGDYINTLAPTVITASDVRTMMLSPDSSKLHIIDIRTAGDFDTVGHISGAHNVTVANLLTHVKTLNMANYDKVVIACYSGQTSGFATSLMRLMGYSKTWSLKWGMSSWDSVFAAKYWLVKTGNSRLTDFTTDTVAKNPLGSLPTLSTGKTTGAEILEARVNALLTAGYSPATTIDHTTLFANLSNYYIINYWPRAHFENPGHISGAVHYEPKIDLKSTTNLKTIPTDKTVVLYCYTGQTSSFVASAYLRVLGYDAKSLLYGGNSMIYDILPANKFTVAEIKGYPYVKGS